MPSLPPEIKILLILEKTTEKWKLKLSRISLFHMKTRVCLKYFVNACRLFGICEFDGDVLYVCLRPLLQAFSEKFIKHFAIT